MSVMNYAPQAIVLLALWVFTLYLLYRLMALPKVQELQSINQQLKAEIEQRQKEQQISHDELEQRVKDRTADLAEANDHLQRLATHARTISSIIQQVRRSLDLNTIFTTTTAELRRALACDRVLVYRFKPDWSGYIAGESVLPGWPTALGDAINDPCIPQNLIEAYKQGRVVPTADVMHAGFHPDHQQLMERLQIKANLVVPIVTAGELFGLLVAHHCAQTHDWQPAEVQLLHGVDWAQPPATPAG
jgi:methyl-accepting chemotaxis protein PixJ